MLTDVQCRGAKKQKKAYKLTDPDGLFLFITPTGYRSWRYRYRFGGKQKQVVLGSYPEMTLRAAREFRDDQKLILRNGSAQRLQHAKGLVVELQYKKWLIGYPSPHALTLIVGL